MTTLCRHFVFLSVVFFFSNLSWYLSYAGFPVVPWHTYLLVLGGTLMFTLLRLPEVLRALPAYLLVWVWLYLIHGILMFFYSSQHPDGLEMVKDRLIDGILLVTCLMLLNLRPGMVRVAQWGILWTLFFAVGMNLLDFINPMFSFVEGRAAGFYVNPNIAGRVMSLGMVACIPLVPPRLRFTFCLVIGIGVFATFSRSGWFNWTVGIIALTVHGLLVFRHKWPSILFFSLLGLTLIYVLLSGLALEVIAALHLDGYLTPDTLSRLSGFEITFRDYSTGERLKLIPQSWEVIRDHPLLGAGADLRLMFDQRPHNMYLLVLTQGGMLGLLMFVTLLWLLWHHTSATGRATIVVYVFSSLFTHNNLEGPTTLLIVALIASLRPTTSESTLQRYSTLRPSHGEPWTTAPRVG